MVGLWCLSPPRQVSHSLQILIPWAKVLFISGPFVFPRACLYAGNNTADSKRHPLPVKCVQGQVHCGQWGGGPSSGVHCVRVSSSQNQTPGVSREPERVAQLPGAISVSTFSQPTGNTSNYMDHSYILESSWLQGLGSIVKWPGFPLRKVVFYKTLRAEGKNVSSPPFSCFPPGWLNYKVWSLPNFLATSLSLSLPYSSHM